MPSLVTWIDRKFYSRFPDAWDTLRFRDVVVRQLNPSSRVLDFGAGRGAVPHHDWRGHAEFVAGVDVDPEVLKNPHLHEAKLLIAPDFLIPYPNCSFDAVISVNVFEHLSEPEAPLREIARVLRPGGVCLIQTPNRRHYVPLVAGVTPHWFHVWVNRRRGVEAHDTFPTYYRCNTPTAIRRAASRSGLLTERIERWEGRPEYLRMNAVAYLVGLAYEKLVNSTERLAGFRCVLAAALRKPAET